MAIGNGGGIAQDRAEGPAWDGLQRLRSQGCFVPFGNGFRHALVAVARQDRALDDGLAKSRLEHGQASRKSCRLIKGSIGNRRSLEGAGYRDKKQECAEDDGAEAHSHDDIDAGVFVRHNDLLVISSHSGSGQLPQAVRLE